MTAALEGGEWSAAHPGRTLPPEKTRYPLYRRLGGLQGQSGRAENLVPTGIRSRTVQPVVSRYTDWATLPTSTASRMQICVRWEAEPRLRIPVPIHVNAVFYHRLPTCTAAAAKSQPYLGIYQKQPASLASLSKPLRTRRDEHSVKVKVIP